MALTLLAGPANAGKVALLLERYLTALDREPFLIVPNRSDVGRVERELLASCGALLGGQIGTFDDFFRLWLRGPDRCAMDIAGGPRRPGRGDRLTPLRARPPRLCVAGENGRRPVRAGSAANRGAAAATRRAPPGPGAFGARGFYGLRAWPEDEIGRASCRERV